MQIVKVYFGQWKSRKKKGTLFAQGRAEPKAHNESLSLASELISLGLPPVGQSRMVLEAILIHH